MSNIISVVNQKGGVGKTTTTVSLSSAIAKSGKKTLVIDIDAQGNTTSGYGINKRDLQASSYEVIVGEKTAGEAIIHTQFGKVDLIPATASLAAADIELAELEKRAYGLKTAIASVADDYDYIFIDCPPSLGLLTINALTASDSILIPMQCEFYSLEGLAQLMDTVRQVKQRYNKDLKINGILFTMYDARLKVTVQVVEEVKKHFGDIVFKTVIPRNVRLSEAPSFGEPIVYYDKSSKGAKAYLSLAKEIINRDRKGKAK